MSQSSCTLAKSKSLGAKLLCIATCVWHKKCCNLFFFYLKRYSKTWYKCFKYQKSEGLLSYWASILRNVGQLLPSALHVKVTCKDFSTRKVMKLFLFIKYVQLISPNNIKLFSSKVPIGSPIIFHFLSLMLPKLTN